MLLGTDIHPATKQRHYKAEAAPIMGAVIRAAVLTDKIYNKDTDHAAYSPAIAQMHAVGAQPYLGCTVCCHPTGEHRYMNNQ
jgi:hypothetical protein